MNYSADIERINELIAGILPKGYEFFTSDSEETECLYSYIEYKGKKIFFNFFYNDDDKLSNIGTLNILSENEFTSREGFVNDLADVLSRMLKEWKENDEI